jgi:hypothetical protein
MQQYGGGSLQWSRSHISLDASTIRAIETQLAKLCPIPKGWHSHFLESLIPATAYQKGIQPAVALDSGVERTIAEPIITWLHLACARFNATTVGNLSILDQQLESITPGTKKVIQLLKQQIGPYLKPLPPTHVPTGALVITNTPSSAKYTGGLGSHKIQCARSLSDAKWGTNLPDIYRGILDQGHTSQMMIECGPPEAKAQQPVPKG